MGIPDIENSWANVGLTSVKRWLILGSPYQGHLSLLIMNVCGSELLDITRLFDESLTNQHLCKLVSATDV